MAQSASCGSFCPYFSSIATSVVLAHRHGKLGGYLKSSLSDTSFPFVIESSRTEVLSAHEPQADLHSSGNRAI